MIRDAKCAWEKVTPGYFKPFPSCTLTPGYFKPSPSCTLILGVYLWLLSCLKHVVTSTTSSDLHSIVSLAEKPLIRCLLSLMCQALFLALGTQRETN